MDAQMLKNLAKTQLDALAQMAHSENLFELEQQFKLFSLTLSADAPTIPPAVAETDLPYENHPYEDEDEVTVYDEEFITPYEDEDEDDVPNHPEGFNDEDEFSDFLADQEEFITNKVTVYDEETGEETEVTMTPQDVVGVAVAWGGGYKDVGNLDDSVTQLEQIEDLQNTIYDETTGEVLYRNEPEPVETIRVRIVREDGLSLSDNDVTNRIFTHRQAAPMLQIFGQEYNILNTENDSEKIVAFTIDQDNNQSKVMAKALSDGQYVNFGGRVVIPGLGLVTATPVFGNEG